MKKICKKFLSWWPGHQISWHSGVSTFFWWSKSVIPWHLILSYRVTRIYNSLFLSSAFRFQKAFENQRSIQPKLNQAINRAIFYGKNLLFHVHVWYFQLKDHIKSLQKFTFCLNGESLRLEIYKIIYDMKICIKSSPFLTHSRRF